MAVHLKTGLNSIIILGAWILWNIRNWCVFDADSPNLARTLLFDSEELIFWGFGRGMRNQLPTCPGAEWELILG